MVNPMVGLPADTQKGRTKRGLEFENNAVGRTTFGSRQTKVGQANNDAKRHRNRCKCTNIYLKYAYNKLIIISYLYITYNFLLFNN